MKPLVWVGHFRGFSGSAATTRSYTQALMRHYPDITVVPVSALESNDPFAWLVKNAPAGAFKLVHNHPTTDPEADAYFSNVTYDRVLPEWAPLFEYAKGIFAQSRFCQDNFAKVVSNPGKIYVVPYILPPNIPSRTHQLRIFPADK